MQEHKYITFDDKDIMEALEDLYEKKNGEKMSISFDQENERKIRQIRSITIRKSLTSSNADIANNNGPKVDFDQDYGEIQELGKSDIAVSTTWNQHYLKP